MSDDDKCGAVLLLADDFADNECTIRCARESGHGGHHLKLFEWNACDDHLEWTHRAWKWRLLWFICVGAIGMVIGRIWEVGWFQ